MSSPDPSLHSLYSRLEEVLGPEHADTLMTRLPPFATTELASRTDVAELGAEVAALGDRLHRVEDRIDHKFERLDVRFDSLQDAIRDQLKTYTLTTVGAMTALTAIYAGMLAVFL